MKETILLIEDEKLMRVTLEDALRTAGYEVTSFETGTEALRSLKSPDRVGADVVVTDVRLPDIDGLNILEEITQMNDAQVIVMTAFGTIKDAVNAMRLGAFDYITKPFSLDEFLLLIERALEVKKLRNENIRLKKDLGRCYGFPNIIGEGSEMKKIFSLIERVSGSDSTILILGESGTGKELIATTIHYQSKRKDKPLIKVNCAAMPEGLIESELFGYEKGAFTGADFRRIGKFEQCNGGTIFLDEIGDMPLTIQAKLLRVLQDGTFQRLGGGEEIKTDVRLIAATNKDLEHMVKNNTFREDLYYRINVVTIDVPPLRERQEDIKELVQYFIQKYNKKLGKEAKGITSATLKKLEEQPWHGNVRELENVIQKAMVFCSSDYLSAECCKEFSLQPKVEPEADRCITVKDAIQGLVDLSFREGCHEMFQDIVGTLEKSMVKRALELTKGNQVQAAKLLGISRNTLRKKLGED